MAKITKHGGPTNAALDAGGPLDGGVEAPAAAPETVVEAPAADEADGQSPDAASVSGALNSPSDRSSRPKRAIRGSGGGRK
jgi:hypothetical protein